MGLDSAVPLAAVPTPATSPPPAVGDSNVTGDLPQYALANHTHASSVQKAVVDTDGSGNVTWTFPKPYDALPVVHVTVETASGQPYVALISARSTTAVTIKVLRAQTLPASIALLSALVSFNLFGGAVGAGVKVHIFAAKATT